MFEWNKLENPVHSVIGQSIKDYCCARKDGLFYLFYSVFYEENGKLQCGVCEISTADFLTYSENLLWFGAEQNIKGYASPDIIQVGDTYYLTLNSWGDMEDYPNQLWFTTSTDLRTWTPLRPLAANLTRGIRSIDAALIHHDDTWRLMWKGANHTTMLAKATTPDGDFEYVGDGIVTFERSDDSTTVGHENYQLMTLDGIPHLLTTHFEGGHLPVLYALAGVPKTDDDWLHWHEVATWVMPNEGFNTVDVANASAFYDWREHDGYYYLLYAGTTESETYRGDSWWGRGWNQLALARSQDMENWVVAGKEA